MRRPHIEPAQRTVRYHSAPSPNSLATIARLISFPIRFVCRTGSPPLCDFDVLCRRFATVADDFEFDLLALIECCESGTFHRRDMNEHVLSTSFRLDEAVAFGWVEPLYISYCHLDISRTLNDVLMQAARFRRIIQGTKVLTSGVRPTHDRRAIQPDHRRLFLFLYGRPRIWLGLVCRPAKALAPSRPGTPWPAPLIQSDAQFSGPQDAS